MSTKNLISDMRIFEFNSEMKILNKNSESKLQHGVKEFLPKIIEY